VTLLHIGPSSVATPANLPGLADIERLSINLSDLRIGEDRVSLSVGPVQRTFDVIYLALGCSAQHDLARSLGALAGRARWARSVITTAPCKSMRTRRLRCLVFTPLAMLFAVSIKLWSLPRKARSRLPTSITNFAVAKKQLSAVADSASLPIALDADRTAHHA
jgi:hypothetical protein